MFILVLKREQKFVLTPEHDSQGDDGCHQLQDAINESVVLPESH